MAAAGSMLKGREAVFSISSSDEESDSWVGEGDEEDDDDDDGEGEEEYSQSEDEDYEDEESESDQEVCTDSDESSDEDEEYESVSDDQSNEDDDNNACYPKEGKPTDDKLSDKVTDLLRQNFDKMSRSGKVLGKRTIVGRVVKESYGVEVLWSKGVKPLPPLYPLLVKGRNLYRFRTFRQEVLVTGVGGKEAAGGGEVGVVVRPERGFQMRETRWGNGDRNMADEVDETLGSDGLIGKDEGGGGLN
ncbi:Zinc finger CCCH domain-containing protein 62 [Platanthera guangdongensis]|uniref:Zinc finger CCCH domain-containing protein 62 n=1 Tax=Platanthera guangdongensis TaxID=2320717 RepID=A0ABR2MX65_9ASPA